LRVRIVPGWCVTAELLLLGERLYIAPTALLIGGAKELTQLVVDLLYHLVVVIQAFNQLVVGVLL